jgi:hypothetical protein
MEKSEVRMISDYFTLTFTVESPSTTKATLGSWAPAWVSAGTFKGWMDLLTGRDANIGAQYIDQATHIIGCGAENSWVTNRMRVKDPDGLIYRVLHNDDPVHRSHHREILLQFNQADNLST